MSFIIICLLIIIFIFTAFCHAVASVEPRVKENGKWETKNYDLFESKR